MESSTKIMKATGIIHIIHGSIMVLISFYLMILAMLNINILVGLLVLALSGGLSFLYIYVGYELFALRNPNKMKNLLIAAIILACIEVITSMVRGEMAGVIFIAELIMSVIAICNIDSYKRYKKNSHGKKR